MLFGGGLFSTPLRAGLFSSVEARSTFSSAIMLELSWSTPGPGEGEASSASGDILNLRYDGVAEWAARSTRAARGEAADSVEGSAQAGKARELQSPARRWPDMADPLLRNSSSGPNSWSSVGCAQSPATLPSVRSHAGCCAARDRGATEDAPFSWQEYSGWMRAGLGWCPERFVQRRSRAFSRLLRAETAAQQ